MPKQDGGVWASLSALDAFPKVNEDFFKKTMSGGVITILASLLMTLLFISELSECGSCVCVCSGASAAALIDRQLTTTTWPISAAGLYLTTQTTHELIVDTSRGAHIDINVCQGSREGLCLTDVR